MGIRITSTIKERVKKALLKTKYLRDDDNKLCVRIWEQDIKALGFKGTISLDAFLLLYMEGNITNPETIRRSRQQLQQLNPDLRGKNYNARHGHQETVKKDLGYK